MDSIDTKETEEVQAESTTALNNGVHTSEITDDGNGETQIKKKRVPRRVLHFSDGVLEEYSTDEDTADGDTIKKTTVQELTAVDPKLLTWGPWFMYKASLMSSKTLSACDYAGEKLASFFGITSPKYEYEIGVYEAMKSEDEEKRKQEDLEMGGWIQPDDNGTPTNMRQ